MLEKYGVLIYGDKMIKHIIYHAMSPNTEFKTEVNICRSPQSSTFVKESTYLSTVVAIIYPSTNPSSDRFRKGSIYAAGHRYHVSGRGGHFGEKG